MNLRVSGIGLKTILILGLAAAGAVHGAVTNTYYVSPSGSATAPFDTWASAATGIAQAVVRAEADLGGSVTACVVVVGDGTYAVSAEIPITRAIAVRSANGADATIVRGNYPASTNRIFRISGTNAVLDGFTVTNGYLVSVAGGGIVMTANSVIENCIITGNTATNESGGGLSFIAGTVRNCVIRGNHSGQGAGFLMSGSASVMRNCLVENNRCTHWWKRGGGTRIDGGLLENCVFRGNYSAEMGGGVHLQGNATVRNCLIQGNRADQMGGGVYLNAGTLQNCTVVNNDSVAGGGTYQAANSTIRNSIVYFNTAPAGYNWFRVTGTITASCLTPAYLDNVAADPQFISATDFHLLPGSPCLDAGLATSAPTNDLDGAARPKDGDGNGAAVIDIGAYEADNQTGGVFRCNFIADPIGGFGSVTSSLAAYVGGTNLAGLSYRWTFGDGAESDWATASSVSHTYGPGLFTVGLAVSNAAGETAVITKAGAIAVYPAVTYVRPDGAAIPPYDTWEKAATGIQEAVDAAGVVGSQSTLVLVSNGTYTLTGTVQVLKGIVVRGMDRDGVVVDGNRTNRCFLLSHDAAVLENLTVSNGYAYGSVTASRGGGVCVEAGTLRDCVVRNCESTGGGGGVFIYTPGVVSNCVIDSNFTTAMASGAGVYLSSGKLLDCTVQRNAFRGGGMGYGSGLFSSAGTVSNCLFSGNTNGYRGNVYISSGILSRSRIEGNRGGSEGSGVFIDNALMEGCVVAGNVGAANGQGGGVLARNTTVRNCGIWGNSSRDGGGVFVPSGYQTRLENCTIAGNLATNGGGTLLVSGTATNTIVYHNSAAVSNDIGGVLNYAYSCSPELTGGVGNVTADPWFVSKGSGFGPALQGADFRLLAGSPCLDAGTSLPWMAAAADLAGEPRVQGGRVNIGAYEGVVMPRGTLLLIR